VPKGGEEERVITIFVLEKERGLGKKFQTLKCY
jgi:hypothetical protein